MIELNHAHKMGLSEYQVELFLSQAKYYYEANEHQKLKKIKENCHSKLKKVERINQSGIPYDLIQVGKANERKLARKVRKGLPMKRVL